MDQQQLWNAGTVNISAGRRKGTFSASGHTQIQEAEKRIFDKWYATATTGAKLRYWQQRIQQLKARQPDSPAAG